MNGELGHDAREAAAIVGWLQGFAPTVWLLPLARPEGSPLVDGDVCEEYERRVDRLAEIVGLGKEERCG